MYEWHREKYCICGCGRLLDSKNPAQKYYDNNKCRYEFFRKNLAGGCLPIDQVVFGFCLNCGMEIISWKNSKRKTCSHLTGSNCDVEYRAKLHEGNNFGSKWYREKESMAERKRKRELLRQL